MNTIDVSTAEDIELRILATRARRNVLRMLDAGGSGHLGGAYSCIDIVTALYARVLRHDPANPGWAGRDRFLLSAGHKALAQYAVLALFDYFPAEVLDTYGAFGTVLPGHPDMKKLPGVEANTGALGHGTAIAAGMAMAARTSVESWRTFVLLGDGELAEGSNWEAFAMAAHHRLGNLTAIIDVNGLQISGEAERIMGMEPIAEKMRAFGWTVQEIDGHDHRQILDALGRARVETSAPTAVVAHTVKGEGLGRLAGTVGSHYWTPSREELGEAFIELDRRLVSLGRERVA
ncbi:transketolase [Microbacterium aquimaris]|uniref:Transketolase n=1 Tax=Microbacterium aquimaris TaxID=459816 RepID=A0ABU5N5F2_9MICO|nr:transketolase [Microbacterium aquimaris]MDZ8161306.1 transketolase [Microbacterium aquimaris]